MGRQNKMANMPSGKFFPSPTSTNDSSLCLWAMMAMWQIIISSSKRWVHFNFCYKGKFLYFELFGALLYSLSQNQKGDYTQRLKYWQKANVFSMRAYPPVRAAVITVEFCKALRKIFSLLRRSGLNWMLPYTALSRDYRTALLASGSSSSFGFGLFCLFIHFSSYIGVCTYTGYS